jgi:hypothetical protein
MAEEVQGNNLHCRLQQQQDVAGSHLPCHLQSIMSAAWNVCTWSSYVHCRSHLAPPLLWHIIVLAFLALLLQDNNVGLVKQVLASRPMRTIQRLTQTYLTRALADIAKAAGLKTADEAEAMILK